MPDKMVRGSLAERWKQDGNKISARRFYAYYFSSEKTEQPELKGVLSPCHMLSRVKEAAQKVNTLGKGPFFSFRWLRYLESMQHKREGLFLIK